MRRRVKKPRKLGIIVKRERVRIPVSLYLEVGIATTIVELLGTWKKVLVQIELLECLILYMLAFKIFSER